MKNMKVHKKAMRKRKNKKYTRGINNILATYEVPLSALIEMINYIGDNPKVQLMWLQCEVIRDKLKMKEG